MISKSIFLFFLVLGSHLTVTGEVIKQGSDFAAAERAIEAAGYKKTQLAQIIRRDDSSGSAEKPDFDLSFWFVDSGVLVFIHSLKTGKITAIRYELTDERHRSIRKEHVLSVESFDTETGAMLIRTKRPKSKENKSEMVR